MSNENTVKDLADTAQNEAMAHAIDRIARDIVDMVASKAPNAGATVVSVLVALSTVLRAFAEVSGTSVQEEYDRACKTLKIGLGL